MADDRANHDLHDPELIAALLDRDATVTERAAAEARLRSCRDCAALHADLLALAQATAAQPAPGRPRDFSLTAADAARLAGARVGEPGVQPTRLTGVMTVRPDTAAHAAHDTALVASLADRTLPASDRAAAQALVDACDRCAELHADLVALMAATRAMPTPARSHDYTLTASQAARLRSPWRRFLGVLGSPRDALSRPLAVGLTTLGIAGLLVATAPSISFGSASSAGGPVAQPAASAAAGAPARALGAPETPGATGASDLAGEAATAAGSSVPQPAAAASPLADGQGGGAYGTNQGVPSPATVLAPMVNGSSKGTAIGAAQPSASDLGSDALLGVTGVRPVDPLPVVSAAFLVAGLGLFVLRRMARRRSLP